MAASRSAQEGAEATKTMAASAGRASYVPADIVKCVVDPGAQGAAVWLDAIASALARGTLQQCKH